MFNLPEKLETVKRPLTVFNLDPDQAKPLDSVEASGLVLASIERITRDGFTVLNLGRWSLSPEALKIFASTYSFAIEERYPIAVPSLPQIVDSTQNAEDTVPIYTVADLLAEQSKPNRLLHYSNLQVTEATSQIACGANITLLSDSSRFQVQLYPDHYQLPSETAYSRILLPRVAINHPNPLPGWQTEGMQFVVNLEGH